MNKTRRNRKGGKSPSPKSLTEVMVHPKVRGHIKNQTMRKRFRNFARTVSRAVSRTAGISPKLSSAERRQIMTQRAALLTGTGFPMMKKK